MGKKIRKRDILFKALALLVAIGLWVYVSYVESPEIEVWFSGIPITYANGEALSGLNLIRDTESETETVSIKVRGSRGKLFSLSSHDIIAKVDLSGINTAAAYSLPVLISFPVDGFTVVDKKPYNVPVTVEPAITKELPVYTEVVGTPAESCSVTDTEPSVTTVNVTGAASVMGNVQSLIATVNIDGLAEEKSLPADVKIRLVDGTFLEDNTKVEFSDSLISVLIKMNKSVQIPINVNIEKRGGISVKNIKATPGEIEVSGNISIISQLEYIETEPVIINGTSDTETAIAALKIPEGVTTAGKVKTVSVEIELEKEETEGNE